MNINIPEQTIYELKSLDRLNHGEGNYATIEERDAVADRLTYSIMQVIITRLLQCLNSPNSHQ